LQTVGVELGAVSGNVETALYSTLSGTQVSGLIGQSSSTTAVSGWDNLAIPVDYEIIAGTTYYLSVQVDNVNTVIYYSCSVIMYELDNYNYWSFPTVATPVVVTTSSLFMCLTYGTTVQATPTPTPYTAPAPTPTPIGTQPTPYQYPTPTPTYSAPAPIPTSSVTYVLGYGFTDTVFIIIVVAIAIITGCGVYVANSLNHSGKHRVRKRK
jgi:hypothetical protein